MTPAPPLPDHLWNSASPELQAAIPAPVQIHQQRIAELESRVNDLEARLKLNSTNSSRFRLSCLPTRPKSTSPDSAYPTP
jgi:hypothetical protein